jgi:DNA-binding NarL/FixJ family response regulator
LVRWAGDREISIRERSGGTLPEITRRERDVLVTLCLPAASSELFVEPASVREIAARLAVTEAAVKQHLLNLYEKFGIVDCGERRRVALAREAIRRGVVEIDDLHQADYSTGVAGGAS